MKHTLLDLFSGIGGFAKGLTEAGFEFEEHYFSEIDKHAIANYTKNFPHAKPLGTIGYVSGRSIKPTIITFGSPCQDFSLAGKRAGMAGQRSSLILHAMRLIRECQPTVFIWENVKGTFSSNDGEDFWAIIQAFAKLGNYRLEWQLLNTRWFLPQNRERIYLVGLLGGTSEPGIFPIGKEIEGAIEGESETPVVRTLTAGGHSGGLHSGMTLLDVGDFRYDEGFRWREDGECPTLMARAPSKITNIPYIKVASPNSKGFEVAELGDAININRTTSKTRRGRVGKGTAQTLETACNQAVFTKTGIRRLTEKEWERLQGLPDDWTLEGIYDGITKKISATQRYKMIGNGVSVPVVRAIGTRLLNQMALKKPNANVF